MKDNCLWDLNHSIIGDFLRGFDYPHLILPNLNDIISKIILTLGEDYIQIKDGVYAHKSALISSSAEVLSPCIIGAKTEVRHSAYIRGNAIIGEGVVIGNSCEVKNAVIFDKAQVPHYNYVGDSIVGYKAHLGAGVILSNLKSDKSQVKYNFNGQVIESGLKKLGSFIGDGAEIGCNSVLNPGTVIGKNCTVYPLSSVRGYLPENHIYKTEKTIVKRL